MRADLRLAIGLPDGLAAVALCGHRQDDPVAADAVVVDDRSDAGMRDGLIAAIGDLLARCGVARGDLSAVAFEAGPGGFSRIRAACAVAQGLGYGLDIPVGAFDSQLLRAMCARASSLIAGPARVLVARDARMGEAYVSAFEHRDGVWSTILEPAVCALEALPAWAAALPGTELPVLVAGDLRQRLLGAAHPDWREAPEPDPVDLVLTLVRAAPQAARWGDAISAAPTYMREKVALDITEQAALRAARS
ncbi:MAG: tRNA (adenosine(37)-N6)-threonylcarbamoyltransferase complex dimerization subunit type 1 TsaB [Burkholderiaceae bacterium]